jgi:hypothetical protein
MSLQDWKKKCPRLFELHTPMAQPSTDLLEIMEKHGVRLVKKGDEVQLEAESGLDPQIAERATDLIMEHYAEIVGDLKPWIEDPNT